MFFYEIYGKKTAVNVQLELLEQIPACNQWDLEIHTQYKEINGDEVYIRNKGNYYEVKLGMLAFYRVFPREHIISCVACDYDSFFSTLFNIPFSVYFLSYQEVLFHACTLWYKGMLVCLTGEKGVGKSTLMSALNQKGYLQSFGDDTIYLDGFCEGKKAHNLVKQLPETMELLNLSSLSRQNIAGKTYTKIKSINEQGIVKLIIQIRRTNEEKVCLRKIIGRMEKNNIFKSNIVGASYMSHELIAEMLKINFPEQVEFYEMCVPDDLEYVIKNINEISAVILKECTR